MNKFYDKIVAKHKEYLQYNDFLEKKKLLFKDKRQEEVKKVYELNQTTEEITVPDEFTNFLYDLQIEEQTYMQDLQSIFYTLYLYVRLYNELGDGIVLPAEITELCESLEYIIPKPYFIIDDKGAAKEIEKGRLEQRKENITKNYELEKIRNLVTHAVETQKSKE